MTVPAGGLRWRVFALLVSGVVIAGLPNAAFAGFLSERDHQASALCRTVGVVAPVSASASLERRAGLIVEFGDGTRQTFCVTFTEAEETRGFNGVDLLRRSGLPIVFGGTSIDTSICRIGADGCSDPGKCFCTCVDAGSDACRFWGYYQLHDARWDFSETGASRRLLHDGDVDGWRFANHRGKSSSPGVMTTPCKKGAAGVSARVPAVAKKSGGRIGILVGALAVGGFGIAIARSVRRKPPGSEAGSGPDSGERA